MKIKKSLLAFAAPAALIALSGCASQFTAHVARFQQLPVPQGQTFAIVPVNQNDRGGLEFATYANDVAAHLVKVGYRPVTDGTPADMVVQLGYGVDRGQQQVTTTPGGFNCGWGGGWGGWGRRGFRGGWGGGFGGWGGGWRYGWGDPYWGCPDVESYTVYSSHLTMTITRADGTRLFEGRARAHSATDNLTKLVPNLIESMFTGFPGNSGQDIKITIAPDKKS